MSAPSHPQPWARALRQARIEHGWDPHRLASELQRADHKPSATTESLARRIRDWERGKHHIQERYRLLLAQVLDLDAADLAPEPDEPTPQNHRARQTSAHIIALNEIHGSTDLLPLAVRSAHTALADAHTQATSDMASAAAEALQVAGWIAFDADEHLLARRLTSASVLTARVGSDRAAELFALSQLAMHDAHEHRPENARTVSEYALSWNLTPHMEALFLLRLARAHGQSNSPDRAVRTLNRSRSLLQEGPTTGDPPWADWLTDAELHWHEAMIHADNERWFTATDLFEAAYRSRPPSPYRRSALSYAAHHAHALAQVGSWASVHEVLSTAVLPELGGIRSGRTRALLARAQTLAWQDNAPTAIQDALQMATAGL
ncbi:hypothetical protein ABZ234_08390 [Nocardiopsis sp. NPDC006198]|uniref:hypothetical protein n=1 Tax=Nocardiopsis sp. NPDC006198 TaxID=3154472 RepID=UPI0033AE4B5B